MSTNNNDTTSISTCANCGKGGEEGASDLKACTACKLVKYCNRDCQIAHRKQHKRECKKRATEMHDEQLFKQPPPNEDCPICMLPLPELATGWRYKSCCGKMICSGCIHAVRIRDSVGLCPFCRTPTPSTDEMIEQMEKRMEIDDAEAIYNLGCCYDNGQYGLPQNHAKALELWHRAAELGHAVSRRNLGNAYYQGNVVERDKKKATHYYELAAMGGDVDARHNIGNAEGRKGNMDRALKHFMISVEFGLHESLDTVRQMYKDGQATKEDYTQSLRAYQACLGSTLR